MKIERVILRDLRALDHRDDLLVDAEGRPFRAVCLRGLNGSGKTTVLEAVAQLWQWFRRCVKLRGWATPSRDLSDPLLEEAELVAVKLSGLPGPRPTLWLAYGTTQALSALLSQEDEPALRVVDGRPVWDPALLDWWAGAAERAEYGQSDDHIPNVVHIGAEQKVVPRASRKELLSTEPRAAMLWLLRYDPSSRFNVPIEVSIGTLKLLDVDRYARLERWITTLFPGLVLHGFDPETRRPLFRVVAKDRLITMDRLSAGERSVLVNLVTLLRGLQPGGVVLLDEPELHMHISLMRASLSALERFVAELDGQMIVASHAPEVWDHFRPQGALIDLSAPGELR